MSIQTRTYKSGTVRYYAHVFDKNTGKQISGPMREKRREAVLDEANILKNIEAGRVIEKKKTNKTTDEVYQMWKVAAEGHYAKSTMHTYSQYYDRYIKSVFGDKKVSKINPEHVQMYINKMGERYSAETVNKCVNILSVIFKFAMITLKIIPDNPCRNVIRKSVVAPQKTVWTVDQCGYFLQTPEAKESIWYPMFLLSFSTGLRPGEVCGIQNSDLRSGTLMLSSGYDRQRNLTDMKTSQSHRAIPLPDLILRQIKKYIIWKKEAKLRYPEFDDSGFLFVAEDGRPITPDGYYKRFRNVLKAHNRRLLEMDGKITDGCEILPEISLYDVRHCFATNALQEENPDVVANIMGNSVKTLLTRYSHVSTGMRKDAVLRYTDNLDAHRKIEYL